MISKKDFNKVWKDSSKKDILNQFYYDHIEMERFKNIINELEKDLEKVFSKMKEKQVEISGRGYYYTDLIPVEDALNKLKELKQDKTQEIYLSDADNKAFKKEIESLKVDFKENIFEYYDEKEGK